MPEPPEAFRFDVKDALILAALLLVAALALWPILRAAPSDAPGLPGQDGRTQWYPWRAYAADSIRRGVLPLWNPYILCGVPFLGNFQSGLFYPPNLVFTVAPIGVAARGSILFHVWLSMVFAFLLARMCGCGRTGCAVGATAFGLCAAQLLRVPAGHWGASCAIPWLALIFLCTEWTMRRPNRIALVLGAVGVALQVLSGMPQYVFISAVAAGFYALIRPLGLSGESWKGLATRWASVAGMWALGAAIAGIQLLPGLESAAHGARSLPMSPKWIELFSLGPECLLTMVVPGLFGGGDAGIYWGRFLLWEMHAYVGIAALALALYALLSWRSPTGSSPSAEPRSEDRSGRSAGAPAKAGQRRLIVCLAATAGVMLLLALGRHTPLMDFVTLAPLAGMFRGPAKFLLPFSMALSVLAAIGADRLLSSPPKMVRLILPAAVLGAIALAIVLLAPGSMSAWQGAAVKTGEVLYAPDAQGNAAEALPAVRDGWQSLVVLAGLVGCVAFFRRKPAVAGMLLFFIVAADGVLFCREFVGRGTTFRADGSSAWPDGAGKSLRSLGGGERTLALGIREMNDGMLERVPTIEGIEPNPPVRFNELFQSAQGKPAEVAPSLYQLDFESGRLLVWTMAAGHVLAPEEVTPVGQRAHVRWKGAGWNVFDLPSPVPRALVVYRSEVAASPHEALKATVSNDPRNAVILEEGAASGSAAKAGAAAEAFILGDEPNRVIVSATLQRKCWLVLLDNDFPGWKVEVDGRAGKILRADFAFRAVALPAGHHEVVFRYQPESLYWGFGLSVFGLLAAAGIALSTLRRGKTATASAAAAQ